jgi:hypothetical protein
VLPVIVYFLFPVLVIAKNPKMKESLRKELLALTGMRCLSPASVSPHAEA